jgi:preprotein translocase subunit YajC
MEPRIVTAGELNTGDKLVEFGGIAWEITVIDKTAKTVRVSIKPDELAASMLMVRPEPCVKRFGRDTHVNAIVVN